MAKIAEAAGISKALLYHYFPVQAGVLRRDARAGRGRAGRETTQPDPSLQPRRAALAQPRGLPRLGRAPRGRVREADTPASAPSPRCARSSTRIRNETAERILAGIAPNGAAPLLRAAVRGWMWFMDGAILDWLEHRDIDRASAPRPPARHAARRGDGERASRSIADAHHEDRAVVALAVGLERAPPPRRRRRRARSANAAASTAASSRSCEALASRP